MVKHFNFLAPTFYTTVAMTSEMECCFAYNLIEIQKRWLEHSLRMVGSIALFDQLDHILKRGMRKTRKMSMFACDKQNRRAQFGLVLKFYLKRGGSISDLSYHQPKPFLMILQSKRDCYTPVRTV